MGLMPGPRKGTRPAKREIEWLAEGNLYEGECRIDALILAMADRAALRARWLGREHHAVAFGRRALEVARAKGADAWHQADIGPAIEDWSALASAAEKTQEALQSFSRTLCRGKRPKEPQALQRPLRFSGIFQDREVRERWDAARVAAYTIWGSYEIIERVAMNARRTERALTLGRQNSGDPGSVAFATVIGEAWIYLTGKRPAAGRQGGPFQRFLIASWFDLGGTVQVGSGEGSESGDYEITAFISLAEAARDAFPPESISAMLETDLGPDWAR
jgi:hypothetical protein